MTPARVTKLTYLNTLALQEASVFDDVMLVTTATTAEWPDLDATGALRWLDRAMAQMPSTGHPRASLHAVRRKLVALGGRPADGSDGDGPESLKAMFRF